LQVKSLGLSSVSWCPNHFINNLQGNPFIKVMPTFSPDS
jgi:hypothetical protein